MTTPPGSRARLAWWAAAVYLAALGLIAFWPTPVDAPARGHLGIVFRWLHAHGVPQSLGYDFLEFTSNIVLFLPLGLLLGWRVRNWAAALLLAVTCSVLIEWGQAVLLPARYPSWLDVLANTTGALLGLGLCALARRHASRRTGSANRARTD